MTPLNGDNHPAGTRDHVAASDLRHLEGRVDARFQAVSVRFNVVDRRFASIGERLDKADHHSRSHTEKVDAHLRSTEARFHAIDERIDLLDDNMLGRHGRLQRQAHLTFLLAAIAAASGWLLALAVWIVT